MVSGVMPRCGICIAYCSSSDCRIWRKILRHQTSLTSSGLVSTMSRTLRPSMLGGSVRIGDRLVMVARLRRALPCQNDARFARVLPRCELNRARLLQMLQLRVLTVVVIVAIVDGGPDRGQVDQAHLEAAPLEAAEVRAKRIAAVQARKGGIGDLAAKGHVADEFEHLDLADLVFRQAGVAGEGAQQVAGAQ